MARKTTCVSNVDISPLKLQRSRPMLKDEFGDIWKVCTVAPKIYFVLHAKKHSKIVIALEFIANENMEFLCLEHKFRIKEPNKSVHFSKLNLYFLIHFIIPLDLFKKLKLKY
jgi:hypothetical protein